VVIVPDDVAGLGALEQRLDAATLERWIDSMHHADVDVALPRFTIDPPDSLPVGRMLAEMGMPRAFTDHAELDGIAAGEALKIAEVFHKAFVEVNEEGTEAAAGTGIIAVPTSAPMEPAVVHADRPFLFAIRDLQTGAILFMGRVVDPR
jgi:serpin B